MYGTLHADAMRKLAGQRRMALRERARLDGEVRRAARASTDGRPTPKIVVTLSLGQPWVAVRQVRSTS